MKRFRDLPRADKIKIVKRDFPGCDINNQIEFLLEDVPGGALYNTKTLEMVEY